MGKFVLRDMTLAIPMGDLTLVCESLVGHQPLGCFCIHSWLLASYNFHPIRRSGRSLFLLGGPGASVPEVVGVTKSFHRLTWGSLCAIGTHVCPRSPPDAIATFRHRGRSEEHTSELQSLRHLVCRLLLEKKKTVATRRRAIYHSRPMLPSQPPQRLLSSRTSCSYIVIGTATSVVVLWAERVCTAHSDT